MTTVADAPDVVQEDLPPSCKLVWLLLAKHGQLSRQDLLEQTSIHHRTLSDAIERLLDEDVISRSNDHPDLRETVYTLRNR